MMGPVPPLHQDNCLFLDLDGTLLALRDDPAVIRADAALLELLAQCAARLHGALAIISGRPIADIDASFHPLRFAAAGIHGLERRDANGNTTTPQPDTARLRDTALQLRRELEEMPMSQLEDKGASLALHWRRAPQDAPALRILATHALQKLGPAYRLLEGNCVVELLPSTANKGAAVRAFLDEQPFRGRKPVFVGDDLTDVPGFTAAREAGGHGHRRRFARNSAICFRRCGCGTHLAGEHQCLKRSRWISPSSATARSRHSSTGWRASCGCACRSPMATRCSPHCCSVSSANHGAAFSPSTSPTLPTHARTTCATPPSSKPY